MEMLVTITEEMEMATAEETIGDYFQQEEKSPQKVETLNVNENWQLCSKMHRAWIWIVRDVLQL
jgi:hypothetical protein